MNIEQILLENNLNTLFIHSPGATAATVQIWFRSGSALEEKEEQGIAHFLEHMFFKGTATRPGSAIAHEIESYGGEVNAFTSFDYTCYYINTPAANITESVDILLDMVSNPLFEENELIPEREVVFEEYRRSLDSPTQYNFSQIQKGSFLGGYNHQILGTEDTIKNFSREQLQSFRNRYYNNSNALFIIAGDLTKRDKIEQIIKKYQLPNGPHSQFKNFALKGKNTINIHHKDVHQASLTIVIPSPHYEDSNATIEDLAVNILAHGDISPLATKLVNQTSLASNVSGSTMYFNGGGAHFIKFTFPQENLEKVTKEIPKIIKQVIKNGISNEEVDRIKNQYIASKIYEKESIESFAFTLGHGFAQNGDIYCEDAFIDRIRKTYPTSINMSMPKIFAKPMHGTLQLPLGKTHPKHEQAIKTLFSELDTLSKSAISNKKSNDEITSHFDPEVKQIKVKKGVTLLYRKGEMTPTFTLHSYIKGGLSHETKSNNGIYQLLSKTLTYGHKKAKFEELKFKLDSLSAYMNGFSGKNAYGITLHGQTEHFDALLEDYFNTLLFPQIPSNFLKLEKELTTRALDSAKTDPVKQCFTKVNEVMFNAHPYAMGMMGEKNSVKKISRKGLLDLHNQSLKKEEILFTYCGDLELEIVQAKLKNYFDQLSARIPRKGNKKTARPMNGKTIKVDFEREQTQLFIGTPAFKVGKTEDLYLKMLTAYLSGQSSELFVEVRDRQGLCYAVQPVHHTALEAGYWGIYIGAGHDKKDAAKEAILGLLHKLKNNGVSKKEFERVKKMIDGQNLLNVQTIEDYANFYSIPVLHNLGLDYQHKSFEKIRNFQVEEFNTFLRKFLNTKWSIIEVGP